MSSNDYKPDVNLRDFRDQSFGPIKYFPLDPRTLILVSIPLITSIHISLRV